MDVERLARASVNFGYLRVYDPLLVWYGAGAELAVFGDPQVAMFKARAFAETLGKRVAVELGHSPRGSLADLELRLNDASVLDPDTHARIDRIRRTGNQAVHQHLNDLRAALGCVRDCFELGGWLHRILDPSAPATAFVPPQRSAAPTGEEYAPLRADLDRMRDELTNAQVAAEELRTQVTDLAQARRRAEERIAAASASLDATRVEAAQTIEQLTTELAAQRQEYEQRLADLRRTLKVDSRRREEVVELAKEASRRRLRTEAEIRELVDAQLRAAGWVVQDGADLNPFAGRGVAVREARMRDGRADYVLWVDRQIVGILETKREGRPLTGAERQTAGYARGVPPEYIRADRAVLHDGRLPFVYESNGVETHFTNNLDPEPTARRVFHLHQPQTLSRWVRDADHDPLTPTLLGKVRRLPPLDTTTLRPNQVEATEATEHWLTSDARRRGLIQMATGSGKTYLAITAAYRLLKHGGARRVLFLVDRNHLGEQAEREFKGYRPPDDSRTFGEIYPVQRLTGDTVLASSTVVISTIQRLYRRLRGQAVPVGDDPDLDEFVPEQPVEVAYNPAIPPEMFDLIVVDECHRSIYGVWRGVLEYFDAHIVGLTATPTKQALGFFQQNLISEYPFERAVADGVNVDFRVFRIRTEVTEHGGRLEAGLVTPVRDRRTRRERYERLDEDLIYSREQVGKDVIAKDQIRTVLATFKDALRHLFPGRQYVPKTLIYARDDNHADEIVQMVREVFNKGNEFCTKITYTATDPRGALQDFRTSPKLRVAVTVDMIATGTDVRPLECVFFMRGVKSPVYFEQMKGRGSRTLDHDEFQSVTPEPHAHKTHFYIIDAVGVTEQEFKELAAPLERSPSATLKDLLQKAANLTITDDEIATLAARLARLGKELAGGEREELERVAGQPLTEIVRGLIESVDPDVRTRAIESAPQVDGEPDEQGAVRRLTEEALRPMAGNPELRRRILEIRRAHDIWIDEVTTDRIHEARSVPDQERARQIVSSFREYLTQNRDEITAFRLYYEQGNRARVGYRALSDLAARIERPPLQWTPERLWQAYEVVAGPGKVRRSAKHTVADLASLIRFELGLDEELVPYAVKVEDRFRNWLARLEQAGTSFSDEQMWWLERMKDVVCESAGIRPEDLDGVPFSQRGGSAGAEAAFGERIAEVIDELNRTLTS